MGSIEVPLLPKVVTERLIGMYVDGELVPGQRLIETELCERLGVSRSPLREGLRQLASDGLVVLEPRRGAMIAPIEPQDAIDLYQCRKLVQLECIAQVVPHFDETAIHDVERALDELETAVATGKRYDYFRKLTEFHEVLYARCPNRLLSNLVLDLQRQSFRFRFIALRESHHLESSLEGQRKLVSTLISGDVRAVVAQLSGMLDVSLANILHGIELLESENLASDSVSA